MRCVHMRKQYSRTALCGFKCVRECMHGLRRAPRHVYCATLRACVDARMKRAPPRRQRPHRHSSACRSMSGRALAAPRLRICVCRGRMHACTHAQCHPRKTRTTGRLPSSLGRSTRVTTRTSPSSRTWSGLSCGPMGESCRARVHVVRARAARVEVGMRGMGARPNGNRPC